MRWEHGTTGSWNSLAGLQNRDKGGSTAHWHLILMLRPPSSGRLVGAPCFRACPPPRGRKALSSPQETAARFRGPQWRRPQAHTTPSARFPGESSSLPALGEKVLSEQELALPHPRSADKVSVWPPKLALCLLDGSGPGPGRTEGSGTGGASITRDLCPSAWWFHPAWRHQGSRCSVGSCQFSHPVLALYSRTGEAAAGRVRRPTGPSARGTGPAASGP